MPYSGLGSGLPRALARCPNLELVNDEKANRFIARFPRKSMAFSMNPFNGDRLTN